MIAVVPPLGLLASKFISLVLPQVLCAKCQNELIIFMPGTVDLCGRGGDKQDCHASYAASHKYTNNLNHSNIIQVSSLTDSMNKNFTFKYGLQNVNTCKTSE